MSLHKDKLLSELSEYCRTCASQCKEFKSICDEIAPGKRITEVVNMCTRVSLHEDYIKPNRICLDCVKRLNAAYEFYNIVWHSEERFKKLISSRPIEKIETNCSDSDNKWFSSDQVLVKNIELSPSTDVLCKLENKAEHIFMEEPVVTLSYASDNSTAINSLSEEESTAKSKRRRSRRNVNSQYAQRTSNDEPITEFECYKCKFTFSSLCKVKVHLKENDSSANCRICMKQFTRCEFMQHLCKGTVIDCQYCSNSFKTTVNLVKHINTHHKNHKNYKCYKCARSFHTKLLLEMHKPSHDQEEKRFICEICGHRYRTRFQIKEHMELTHTDKRSFLCATCGKNFNNPTNLRAHTKRHSLTKSVACPKCPKRFFDKYGLKKHIEVHDDAQFVCDICGSVMRSKASYQEHLRRHKKSKVYTCEVCSKQIKTSLYNLRLHMYTHTGEKPFKCPYCDRRYTQNADLNKHLRTHVGENTYKCNICDKSFRLLGELRRHSSEHYQQSLVEVVK